MKKKSPFWIFVLTGLAAGAVYLYFHAAELTAHYLRRQIRALTGTDASLKNVTLSKAEDSSHWVIGIGSLLLKNPDRFEIPNMAQLANVQIVLDPWRSLTESRWVVVYFYAALRRINFQTNNAGVFNITTTPAIRDLYAKDPAPSRRDFLMERVEFKFGKLYRIDYSKAPPSMERHDLKGKILSYRNLDSPYVLIQAPVLVLLKHRNIEERELIQKLKTRLERYEESLKAA